MNNSPQQGFAPSVDFSKRVLTAFKQGQNHDENCGPISVVKCSIATFGPEVKTDSEGEGVFSSDIYANGVHRITLRNGVEVTVSDAETQLAAENCGFILPIDEKGNELGDSTILVRARYIYAVLVKGAVEKAKVNPGSFPNTFDAALDELTHRGLDADDVAPLLGLGSQTVQPNKQVAYLFGNYYHATFATGDEYDEYGFLESTSQFERLHHSWHHNNEFWSLVLV